MNKPLKQLPTFVWRTYSGGAELRKFLNVEPFSDSDFPEDWISSFTEAKNKNYVPNEGITRVESENGVQLITDVVTKEDFGEGREESGVLIKFLDSSERLGIQVHPTKENAKKFFASPYGKTECWHILETRTNGEVPAIYLGFKEFVTKELWADLFKKQDIQGMLNAMHRFEVKKGDTVLVTGGTPHAIGAGCFLLEIQEPTDYTLRTEKITVSGLELTPMQVHYGIGEENMLECFDYTPRSKEEIYDTFFIKPEQDLNGLEHLVSYRHTPCFALDKATGGTFEFPHFITVISLENRGKLLFSGGSYNLSKGDKFFIPAKTKFELKDANAILCYPPERK